MHTIRMNIELSLSPAPMEGTMLRRTGSRLAVALSCLILLAVGCAKSESSGSQQNAGAGIASGDAAWQAVIEAAKKEGKVNLDGVP
jgi:hypothetical protein